MKKRWEAYLERWVKISACLLFTENDDVLFTCRCPHVCEAHLRHWMKMHLSYWLDIAKVQTWTTEVDLDAKGLCPSAMYDLNMDFQVIWGSGVYLSQDGTLLPSLFFPKLSIVSPRALGRENLSEGEWGTLPVPSCLNGLLVYGAQPSLQPPGPVFPHILPTPQLRAVTSVFHRVSSRHSIQG